MRVAGSLSVVFLAGSLALASEQAVVERESQVNLSGGATLVVSNLLGSVEVIGGERSGIARIEIRVTGESKTEEAARALAEGVTVEIEDGASPSVTTTFPVPDSGELAFPRDEGKSAASRFLERIFDRTQIQSEHGGRSVTLGRSRNAEKIAAHIRVRVPHDANVVVRQAAGSVLAARFRGHIVVETRGGSIRLEQAFGSAELRTESAEVEVSSFQGESVRIETLDGSVRVNDTVPGTLAVTTGSGTVAAARVQAGALSVATGEGEIELDAVEAQSFDLRSEAGEIRMGTRMKGLRRGAVRTASGDIQMSVGGVTPFAVRATVPEGSLATDRLPDLERVGTEGTALVYRRGSPGAEIEIATESGEVSFRPM